MIRDKRPVDELSVEELERILILKKREARMQRFRDGADRRVDVPIPPPLADQPHPVVAAPPAAPIVQETAPAPAPDQKMVVVDDDVPRFEDDLIEQEPPAPIPTRAYQPPSNARPRRMGWLFNRALFLVEVGGLIGLLVLVYFAFKGNQIVEENVDKTSALNATAEAEWLRRQIQPTATPLISINAVVLPGGHVWSASGDHQFNLEEVPTAYRASYQKQMEAPRIELSAPPPPGSPIQIRIDRIGVNSSIRAGDSWATLQAAVGHHAYSSNPGIPGNTVLVGHNDIFGEVFRRLPELQIGDEIRIQAEGGKWYTYVVEQSFPVEPSDTWVLNQNTGGEAIATLITCYPYRVNDQRWIIQARLINNG